MRKEEELERELGVWRTRS